jgi:hypothetical protein
MSLLDITLVPPLYPGPLCYLSFASEGYDVCISTHFTPSADFDLQTSLFLDILSKHFFWSKNLQTLIHYLYTSL